MQAQHNSPGPANQEPDSFAALRQDLPEAAVRPGLKGSNPNWQFAAGVFSFSAAMPCTTLTPANCQGGLLQKHPAARDIVQELFTVRPITLKAYRMAHQQFS
jgi:hypothetical protein